MRVVIRKHFLRSRRAADVIVLLQQQDAQARARQIRRRDQPVMPGAKNNDVVFEISSRDHTNSSLDRKPFRARIRPDDHHSRSELRGIFAARSSRAARANSAQRAVVEAASSGLGMARAECRNRGDVVARAFSSSMSRCARRGDDFDVDTPAYPKIYEHALRAAGAAVDVARSAWKERPHSV